MKDVPGFEIKSFSFSIGDVFNKIGWHEGSEVLNAIKAIPGFVNLSNDSKHVIFERTGTYENFEADYKATVHAVWGVLASFNLLEGDF